MMGICAQELREYVIRPTLKALGAWSSTTEDLLLGTAIQESGLGFHLQFADDTGIGIYKIRPAAHRKIWDKYLAFKPELASKVRGLASQKGFLQKPDAELATNLSYATAIVWLIYLSQIEQLPENSDVSQLADLWHKYFRQSKKGSPKDFVNSYLTVHEKTIAA